ncbi:glycosyltransferase [Thioalkalivibrio sp. HL-Eb18]|uniref:glycosyltransferase family 4 protein n=1 Tax=Thioalkalivibrio sp. HL-Eb18 TaxID=1266913 RepID=UPI0012DF839A|nr:glycosyltransferase [Thioalkalivibrio sp. HL-Eb18]
MRENATRVAVIVHNSVIKDARVLKEVKTLWESGLAVDVYGVKTDREVMAKKIEGCRSFTLIDLTSRCTKLGYQFHIYKIILRSVNAVNKFRNDLKKIVKGSSGILFGLIGVLAGVFIGGSSDPGKFSLLVLMFLSLLLIAYAAWPLLFEKVGYVKRKAAFERVGGALFNAIKSEEYDYVHCHDLIALIPGLRYKKENPSVKLIWDAHELYDEVAYSSCMERVYIRELMRTASRKIDSFVTISDSF